MWRPLLLKTEGPGWIFPQQSGAWAVDRAAPACWILLTVHSLKPECLLTSGCGTNIYKVLCGEKNSKLFFNFWNIWSLGDCLLVLSSFQAVQSFWYSNHDIGRCLTVLTVWFKALQWEKRLNVFQSTYNLPMFILDHLQHHPHVTVWWMLLTTDILCSFFWVH